MKIFLTGASGLLGRALFKELNECGRGFEVLGTAFSRTSGSLKQLNLLDSTAVKKMISDFGPDLVIHSAAERRPDVVKADPEKAQKINVDATGTVAEAASACGASILYMSSNYVFDGRNPPYYPDSAVNPLNEYGQMKLTGEHIVLEKCPDAIILRIPIVYGRVEYLGESTVTVIADEISADSPAYFDNRQMRFPTHAGDISNVISGLAGLLDAGEEIKGIYHWSSETSITKFGIAKILAGIMGIDPELIREAAPDPNAAPRPENAKLDTGRIRRLGLGTYRDFEQAIREILMEVSEQSS